MKAVPRPAQTGRPSHKIAYRATVLALALLGACSAGASPTSLICIPSADIVPHRTIHLELNDYCGIHTGHAPADFGLTVGCSRFEIGVDLLGRHVDAYFNAKYLVCSETGRRPQLSVGLCGVGINRQAADLALKYVVMAKSLLGGRLHFGYMHGRRAALGPDNDMLMIGYERQLNDRWCFAADYQSGDSECGAAAVGLTVQFADNANLMFGYVWPNSSDYEDYLTFTLGVDLHAGH